MIAAVASGEKSLLGSIRAIQHRDALGNPIGKSFFPQFHSDLVANTILPAADPDRSNPTRSRWERPLDTIRSFEAAIDGNYSRKSYMRTGQTLWASAKIRSIQAYMLTYLVKQSRMLDLSTIAGVATLEVRSPQEYGPIVRFPGGEGA